MPARRLSQHLREGTRLQQRQLAQSIPASNRTASPTKTSATFALLSAADEALVGKQPEQAILLMERAVRIEPRNFELWIRLSRAHLASGNLAPAINTHAKPSPLPRSAQVNLPAPIKLKHGYNMQKC